MSQCPALGSRWSGAEHEELMNRPGDTQVPTSSRLQEKLLNQFLLPP